MAAKQGVEMKVSELFVVVVVEFHSVEENVQNTISSRSYGCLLVCRNDDLIFDSNCTMDLQFHL